MDNQMEKIIAKDLGISVTGIRNSSWETLESTRRKRYEKPFRPEGMFLVGGNINLSLRREMGTQRLSLREMSRKVSYNIKCLLKNKRNV